MVRNRASSNRLPTVSLCAWPCSTISSAARRQTLLIPQRTDRMLLIKNGRVIDPAGKIDAALDGDRISKAGANLAANGAEVFDAKGMIVAPGFIDLHCHLREPGQEMSETIETGTQSAARGGFTAVCCMPNTLPVNDNASVTRSIVERAAVAGAVRVWPIGAASLGSKGEALAEISAMKAA